MNEWIFVKLPWGNTGHVTARKKHRVRTYGLLGEDGALHKALDDERVVLLQDQKIDKSLKSPKKQSESTNAEEEPLEIAGHLEDGAVRYFLAGRNVGGGG